LRSFSIILEVLAAGSEPSQPCNSLQNGHIPMPKSPAYCTLHYALPPRRSLRRASSLPPNSQLCSSEPRSLIGNAQRIGTIRRRQKGPCPIHLDRHHLLRCRAFPHLFLRLRMVSAVGRPSKGTAGSPSKGAAHPSRNEEPPAPYFHESEHVVSSNCKAAGRSEPMEETGNE
jgi:hypothetical protein